MSMKLLIVDDDLPFRERLTRSMEKKGFEVVSSPGFKDSLLKVTEKNFDYAVVDMRLEDGSGLELVKESLNPGEEITSNPFFSIDLVNRSLKGRSSSTIKSFIFIYLR